MPAPLGDAAAGVIKHAGVIGENPDWIQAQDLL